MPSKPSKRQTLRQKLAGVLATVLCLALAAPPVTAQGNFLEIESAVSLESLASQLGAVSARKSSYLLIDLPELTVAGDIATKIRSEIPGTTHLILVRGRFNPAAGAPSAAAPPPTPPQFRPFQGERPARPKSPVWLATYQYQAGQRTDKMLRFPVEKTEFVTLFAFAQGGWWYATRQIKVGKSLASGASQ